MDLESPAKPGDPKVTSQRAGWRMLVFLLMCLLQAASALTGPRLVSGEPGGAVTIQCRYPSLAINSHLRKYWCRLGPPAGVCRTVVSTNRYTHLRYRGRVALADFPKRGLFVVRLSRLSPEDEGRYRCGLGNSNNALFFSMNLTVSPGLSRTIPTATLDYGELITGSFEITSPPATKRCTRGNTQTTGRQRTGWDTVALTPGARKTTASATGRQTPGATAVVAPGTGSQVEGSVWATVPTVQSPASTVRGMTSATERGLVWSTSNSEATRARASERERETTPGVNRPSEETDSVSATIPAAAVWTSEPTRIEMASAEGSSEGDLDTPAGDGGPRVMPSQALAGGPPGLPTEESSVKSISLEEKNFSGILTPVSSVLCLLMLVTFVLWKRKLQRKGSCEWGLTRPRPAEAQKTGRSSGVTLIQITQFPELGLQPGQPPPVGRKRLQVDPPPLHASLSLPARDPGP
ncbi:PREDICTED: high affinity immunoglobulin alpha and immunoglobulin mu Fc receptor [Bison bison bison]|uniref:high affinity immunoglobulin alpha and immunoglobulin mu Fc receptor n=1 Tax=Bison bison bison TaxID=43346 RepID=UPI000576C39F|nr:PREDICTED: high affinity immunoglobulin alpha and immunoglobulin mu Fc receptor [Bison bison bison]